MKPAKENHPFSCYLTGVMKTLRKCWCLTAYPLHLAIKNSAAFPFEKLL
ncbi:hypothetical protein [Candidatus Odyssella thessalonicensis]|nr:hypothetical protein [Candidatus Odyssella thessalonicensis]